MSKQRQQLLLSVLVGLGVLMWLVVSVKIPVQAGLHWQSVLPQPKNPQSPDNPHLVRFDNGGEIPCGPQQGPVWLEIPAGFTPRAGAEFHCDPTPKKLSETGWPDTTDTWDDRGYLIGFWPSDIPLAKPFDIVYEVDFTQLPSDCTDCLQARYYHSGDHDWKGLPTELQPTLARVRVHVDRFLPESGYPGYADRFVVDLFRQSPEPKPEGRAGPIPTSTPSPTASSIPSPTPDFIWPTLSTVLESPEPVVIALSVQPQLHETSAATTPTATANSRDSLGIYAVIAAGILGLAIVAAAWFLRRRGGSQ